MEQLQKAEAQLKAAHDKRESAYAAEIKSLDDAKQTLLERLHNLDEEKKKVAAENGNVEAADGDVIEINAGGKIIAAKRGTLCQIKGSKFEGLFSGRWDNKLQRDSNGRIFLDVNSDCFQAIVDWLHEVAISPANNRPSTPTVSNEELRNILTCHMELFGLSKSKGTLDGKQNFVAAIDLFTREINDAINEKRRALNVLEAEIASLEKCWTGEQAFIESFAVGERKDVITLNVSGTIVTTKRETLMCVKDSVLAQQFDDTKWTEQGSNNTRAVKEWSPTEVGKWVKSIEGIQMDISELFTKNQINGLELLAMNEFGLEKVGVNRAGTNCLLMKAIKQLEKDAEDFSTLIEYSPYCFGKIVDHLRLHCAHRSKLISEKPLLPSVTNDQLERYKKVLKYYFPGESPDFLLPQVPKRVNVRYDSSSDSSDSDFSHRRRWSSIKKSKKRRR